MTPRSPGRPALLLAAHGSRDPAGVAAFGALAERVAALAGRDGTRVAGGFIELSEPPLRDAVAALADPAPPPAAPAPPPAPAAPAASGPKGSRLRHLVAVPLMLSAAGHAKGDIPAALARERGRHPGLRWTYARPLGPHPALPALLAARIAAVAAGPGGCQGGSRVRPPVASTASPAILVVGRGSTDPDANADVVKTTRLLWEGRDYPLAETAFVSLARPGVAEGLERCRLLGARRIVVARYFLFPGVLPDRVAEQAARYAAAHPGLDIRCTGVLGDCDEIAALVYERYHEALSGDIRMNCDMCVYRTAMPGFEHRVGAPQHPHDHPHDHAHHPLPHPPASDDHPFPHPPAHAHG
jgi:sirohydrochlorin cobaltochelatase